MSTKNTTETVTEITIKSTVKNGDVQLKKQIRKVLPENEADSVVERIIEEVQQKQYASCWREWFIAQGYRPCANLRCTNILPRDASPRRLYCSERCRQAAKSQRWRQRHPEAKMLADKKYLNDILDG
ncbi:MAG: hypothetical protein JRI89_02000 [Deltaproteobacteria bacterium]|nr:hypothetical protein [Deltaproteobacteria bacterium]